MLTQFKCVADALGPFPFGFLSKKLDVAQFSDVAHVRACARAHVCLLYTSPSPRDATLSRMPSSA